MSAFPAFERAQAGLSSRNLAAAASSSSGRPLSSFDPGPSGGSMSTPVPVLALDGDAAGIPPTPEAKVPKISKRTNARLQLAAALIEADNEEIEARAQAAAAAIAGQQHDPNSPHPAPPPQPKLASQSAIFAPYREDAGSLPPVVRARAGSAASRLSRPSLATGDEPRGSIDFLGVRLPTEKKYGYSQGAPSSTGYSHSRAGSIAGTTRLSRSGSLMSATGALRPGDAVWDGPGERPRSSMSHSRRGSLGAMAADAATDDALSEAGSDEALSDWGVEKFLSTDARTRITGRRSRANSSLGHGAGGDRPRSVLSTTSDAPRATSDIGTSATQSGQPGAAAGANAELLARIKLYRERQENLPPSQWDGPGPAADASAVAAHLSTPQGKAAADRPVSTQASPPRRRASSSSTPGALFSTPSPRMTLNQGLGGLGLDDEAAKAAAKKEEGVRQGLVAHERSATVDAAPEHATIMQRRESSMGILGDSWSEQGSDYEAAPEADEEIVARLAQAAGVRISPPSSPGPSSAAPVPQPLAPAFQPSAAAPRPAPATPAEAFHDGSTTGHDFEPQSEDQDMAGVGSFSRSHSRRNSLMASAFLSNDERPAGTMSPVLGPSQILKPGDVVSGGSYSRPGTPGGIGSPARRMSGFATPILGVGAVLAEDPFRHLPQGPSPYPASPANRLMDLGADPYAAAAQMRHRHGESMAGIGAGMMSPSLSFASPSSGFGQVTAPQRKSMPMDSLSTKQLQALARGGAFPEYYGIIDASGPPSPALAGFDEAELLDAAGLDPLAAAQPHEEPTEGEDGTPAAQQPATEPSMPKTSRFSAIFGTNASLADAAEALRDAGEPDLSSVRWGWRKRGAQAMQDGGGENETGQEKRAKSRGLLTTVLPFKSSAAANDGSAADPHGAPGGELFAKLQKAAQEQDDVDDSLISPPSKGPLRPRGLSERLPGTLTMPAPLQGSRLAPRMRLTPPPDQVLRENVAAANAKRQSQLHVPEGFVLHNRGLPAMRQLQVGGAAGPRPLFMAPQGDKKHDAVVSAFLNSAEGRRLINIPAAAPAGIGRRAAAPTTALFRNQLVQHDDEREGWGWEATASQAPEDEAAALDMKKKSKGAAKRAEKKAAKLKRKRKAARAERRRKREAAKQNGTSYEAVAEEESPDEDLDLSEDSSSEASDTDSDDASDASWNTEDEKRWIDNQKPAGKLFGKSLLDVAAEKKHINVSKNRYYGQTEIEEMNQADAQSAMLGDGQSIAPSAAARSFRDNPLGYNDTRERMQAAFGTDHIWAREMAKRREEEAREAEEREVRRLAEEEYQKAEAERKLRKMRGKKGKQARAAAAAAKAAEEANKTPRGDALQLPEERADGDASPPRSRTPIQAPQIALDLPTDDAGNDGASSRRSGRPSETAAEWFARSDDEESSDGSSLEDEAERRRQALQRARQSMALDPSTVPVLSIDSTQDGDSDSSEDNVPLSQLRKKAPPSFAAGLTIGGNQSSDEEVPLAAIVAKRKARESKMGTLDLDFGGSPRAPPAPAPALEPESDSSDDAPLGLRHANGAAALAAIAAQKAARREASGADASESDNDSDDAPLGAMHPQAAIIAEQRAVIERLQAENAQAKAQMMGGMPSFGPYGQPAGFDPRMSFMPGMGDPRMSMMNLGMPMNGGMPATASAANLMSYDSAAPHASPMMHQGAAMGSPAMVSAPSMTPLAPPIMGDPKSSSIDRWRSEVAPRAPGSSGPTSKEGSEALV